MPHARRRLSPPLVADDAGRLRLEVEPDAFVDRLLGDALGLAAAKMVRRTLGLAHSIDIEQIVDPTRRATREARALILARGPMVKADACRHAAAAGPTMSAMACVRRMNHAANGALARPKGAHALHDLSRCDSNSALAKRSER